LRLLNQDFNLKKQLSKDTSKLKKPKITLVILLMLLPVFGISLYQHLEKQALIEQASLLEKFSNAETVEEKSAAIEKMLSHTEQQQANNPDNADGWLMLTNSYETLERYPDALRAVENLYRLKGDEPSVMLRYADILSMVNNGAFKGKPTELINAALKLDPTNSSGLWLAGLAAIQRGELNNAIESWEQLLTQFDQGSKSQEQIQHYIDLARKQIVETNTETVSDIALQINISLSENLLDEANDDDDVYIYAQAIDGTLMPLAVLRKKVSDLPIQVTLDDSMALISSNKLSDHKQVQLIARISKSGNAKSTPGDLIGILDSVPTSMYIPLKLIINNIIQ
jgi:cytochrome c-type biogenesis protein CcmH